MHQNDRINEFCQDHEHADVFDEYILSTPKSGQNGSKT